MTERIEEIKKLIDENIEEKEKTLNKLSSYQNVIFEIDKNIFELEEKKKEIEKEIETKKINTFDNFIKVYEKGLDYLKNDLVFFNGNLYKVLKDHEAKETPEKDLENYVPINRKGEKKDDSTTN